MTEAASRSEDRRETAGGRVPLWVKLLYTAFCCVLVPKYLKDYGATNFLYFCDVALLMTLAAVWREDPLLASMPAVGILVPQAIWIADFLAGLAGVPLLGMTQYMFDAKIPLFTRGLSSFHFWLPLFLVWLIWRLGYDRRALLGWTVLASVLILVCYFLMPAPPAPAGNPNLPVNINYVFGLSGEAPQTWFPQGVYLALLLVVLPAAAFIPTHLVLRRFFPQRPAIV
jgi:hypothetical protein